MPETYNEDAVQQILKLAMVRQGQDVALPRSQLVEIAEDLGISESTLVAAEEEWQIQQEEEQARNNFEDYRHQQLQQGIVRFLIVNSGLVLLNLAVAHRINWSVYPVLIWGMAIALQAWQTFRTEGEEYDRAFRRWRLRQQIGQSFKAISERFKFLGLEDRSQPSNFPDGSAAAAAPGQSPFGSPQNVRNDSDRNDSDSNNLDDFNNGSNGSKNSNGVKSAAVVDFGVAPRVDAEHDSDRHS